MTVSWSEKNALYILIGSQWFFDQMENANYHSAYEFMKELYELETEDKGNK